MKHEEASLRTRKALAAALKNAMREKPLQKITVSELIQQCGINRKTFYYHFTDIYDLLKWMFEQETAEVVRQFDIIVDDEDAIAFVMDYVEKNDYIISCAVSSIGLEEMKRFFYADFIGIVRSVINAAEERASRRLEPEFKEFLADFLCEAISGSLLRWVRNKERRDKEKTVQYMSAILKKIFELLENI